MERSILIKALWVLMLLLCTRYVFAQDPEDPYRDEQTCVAIIKTEPSLDLEVLKKEENQIAIQLARNGLSGLTSKIEGLAVHLGTHLRFFTEERLEEEEKHSPEISPEFAFHFQEMINTSARYLILQKSVRYPYSRFFNSTNLYSSGNGKKLGLGLTTMIGSLGISALFANPAIGIPVSMFAFSSTFTELFQQKQKALNASQRPKGYYDPHGMATPLLPTLDKILGYYGAASRLPLLATSAPFTFVRNRRLSKEINNVFYKKLSETSGLEIKNEKQLQNEIESIAERLKETWRIP